MAETLGFPVPLRQRFRPLSITCPGFLTTCPADFVGQVSAVLDRRPGIPAGWRGSTIPGRIAALVQAFAERAQPLPSPLHRSMLLVLDRLVGMGDRRRAAVQSREIFRNVVLH